MEDSLSIDDVKRLIGEQVIAFGLAQRAWERERAALVARIKELEAGAVSAEFGGAVADKAARIRRA